MLNGWAIALATYKEIGHAKGAAKAALLLLRLYLSQGKGWQALKVTLLALKMTYTAGVLHPAILLHLLRQGVPPSQQRLQKIKIPRCVDF